MSDFHDAVETTVKENVRDSVVNVNSYPKCEEKSDSSIGEGTPVRDNNRSNMEEPRPLVSFWTQMWATLVRTLLIKKRDGRKTLVEVFVPVYCLFVLIALKLVIPNPNFPAETAQRVFSLSHNNKVERVAIVAEGNIINGTRIFLEEINQLRREKKEPALNWILYRNSSELLDAFNKNSRLFPMAVIFHTDPNAFGEPLRYTIRTNPSKEAKPSTRTPSTRTLTTSPSKCRSILSPGDWTRGGHLIPLSEMLMESLCPVAQYYFSGFLTLQSLIDTTKIKLDTGDAFFLPNIFFEMLPKRQYMGDWILIFRIIMPMYMVMTLSQFITYLLMFVVGEKEKKIREGMRIMGLRDNAYWISWFIIYGVYVTCLSAFSTVLLFTLKVFQNSSFSVIFLLMVLFGLTIITIAFMLTPFFDKARTAGLVGSFGVNIMSALYFIQVFVTDADSLAFWFISLISPSCYALAMDKAIVMDMAGNGVTWSNIWNGPGMPFGGSLIMMAFDILLYGFVAYWLDAVLPSEYGIKQKPWFCLMPSFWCGRHRKRVSAIHFQSNGESTVNNKDVEPVPRGLKEAIRICGLQKSFRNCRRAEVKAVDGIDLSVYEGQITAILGHNGAGKSTLFNILTGLTAPTNGTAYVYGLDVRDPFEMQEIRQMMGVCPQQDILFDLLSVYDHLKFFASIKGVPRNKMKEEVDKTMAEVNLTEQSSVFAKNLSGGQKRKLSIAIALIGDPKVIILDEPTAGVDPVSRRQMWRILQKTRRGRVLLLTTHFMDEADILGDRKAVISKGRVRCAGTSLFLKNKFGIGYHLTLVLDGSCREHQITRLVRGHVPRAEKARRHGRELSYILPHYAVHLFPPLLLAIEHEIKEKANRLGITSYGVSMTTLEEVFLSLEGENADETEPVEGLSSVKLVRARALSRSLSLQSKSLSYQELNDKETQQKPPSLPTPPATHALHSTNHGVEHVKVAPEIQITVDTLGEVKVSTPSCCRIFRAMLYIRIIRMLRDPYKLYLMIIIPIVTVALGLYIKSTQFVFFKMSDLKLHPTIYQNKTPMAMHSSVDILPEEYNGMKEALQTLGDYPIMDFHGNFTDFLNYENFGGFYLRNFTTLKIYVYFNSTYAHSLPIILNILDNAIYRLMLKAAGALENFRPIEVSVFPFQESDHLEFDLGIIICAMCIGTILSLVPVTLAVDIVYDREIKAKNQLRVNGLSRGLYFVSYFTVLIIIVAITVGGVILLISLNDVPTLSHGPAIISLSVLLLLFSPAAILFNTWLSYLFDKMDSAQSIMPNIMTWVGLVPFFLVAVLNSFQMTVNGAFYTHAVLSFVDVAYIPYAIVYFVDRVHVNCGMDRSCFEPTLSSYLTPQILVMVVAMLFHIPAWGYAIMLADKRKSGIPLCKKNRYSRSKCITTYDETEIGGEVGEDEDVVRERKRVHEALQRTSSHQPALLVHNLRKEYKVRGTGDQSCCCVDDVTIKRTGIARLSMAVEGGEVFGLLGHNGAGKTTTMKIITSEERPTCGSVMLAGQDVISHPDSAFQLLGYCPQHDALWKNVTVKEHLECYAAIRGVSSSDTPRIVDAYLNGLQIMEHANKNAEECSGGTKRKLSFALSMIGNPRVVLLDEPSTGMDPRSKRFLWDTILASFQGKKGAILTTHSMEEADALCSRVGIMVKGGFRCIGSTQHLKNLYGAGYSLEIKIGQNNYNKTMMDNDLSLTPSPLKSSENSLSLGEADEGTDAHVLEGRGCSGETETEAEAVDVSIHTPLVAATPPERAEVIHRSEDDEGLPNAGTEATISMVNRMFPDCTLEENFADRLVFSVPQRSVSSLANSFQQIEEAKERLNIVEYSFSQTTLEQVFLKFSQIESAEVDNSEQE